MDNLNFEKRMDELIKKVIELKKENKRLLLEQKSIKEENIRIKKLLQENSKLVDSKEVIKKKIENLLDKYRQVHI